MIWSVDRLPETDVFLSAHLRGRERFAEIVSMGIGVFVDIAGAAHYVWRPGEEELAEHGVHYVRVDDVEDTNLDLPDFAFDRVADALAEARSKRRTALVFCAAGAKRSPHLLYGVLRSWGAATEDAWATVTAGRPFVDPWQPYLDAAERWVASRAPATG